MKGIVKEFNITGSNEIDIDFAVKKWDNRFSILGYNYGNGQIKYTLYINRKNSNRTNFKTEIFKTQALDLIKRLDLICIQSSTFRSGTAYMTKELAEIEYNRISELYEETLFKLNHLAGIKQSLNPITYGTN